MNDLMRLKWRKVMLVAFVFNILIGALGTTGAFTSTSFVSAYGNSARCPGTSQCDSGGCTTVATGGTCIYFPKPNYPNASCPSRGC